MEDKYATFLAALAGLAESPTPSTRDEALMKAIVDRLSDMAEAGVPEVTADDKDKFLHTNDTTGALEWASGGGGGGSNIFVCKFRWGDDSFVCDKTLSEISDAYFAGTPIIAFDNVSSGGTSVYCEGEIGSGDTLTSITFHFWEPYYEGGDKFAYETLKMDANGITDTYTTYQLTPAT